jgi:hypothetical protein
VRTGARAGVQHGEPEAVRRLLRAVQHRHAGDLLAVHAGGRVRVPQVRRPNHGLDHPQPAAVGEVWPTLSLRHRRPFCLLQHPLLTLYGITEFGAIF